MRLKYPLVGVVLTGLALAGCGTGQSEHIPVIPTTSAAAPAPVVVVTPTEITIPKISAHSTLIPLGINTDPKVDPVGAMQVPNVHTPLQAGYYARGGVRPGQPGPPLVIAGHINGDHQQGIFSRLTELKPGDTATVKLSDRTVLTFRVNSTESDPKTAFPGQKVFGSKDHPTLVLITCGGSFDATARSYRSNIVVFADLAS